jgi:uncharacterized protein (TIGR03083 family)
MTTSLLDRQAYLEHLRRESARFREVLAAADPAARVPSCPDWSADDLLWHLGMDVQHFWAWIVTHRPAGPEGYPEPGRPEGHDSLLEFFDAATAGLQQVLADVDPQEEAWTWGLDHSVGFILRRQAHEAAIHRVDAELATGQRTPIDPALAADGLHEAVTVIFGGHPPWGTFTRDGRQVALRCVDGPTLTLDLGRFAGHDPRKGVDVDERDIALVEPGEGPGDAPGATVTGTAEDLLLWIWGRTDGATLRREGDPAALEHVTWIFGHPVG